MKNKRTKSFNFSHSIKKKQRKQAKNDNSQTFFGRPYQSDQAVRNPMSAIVLQEDEEIQSDFSYNNEEEKGSYRYGFTNSTFIYFLGTLDPKSYLLFVTVIALLIIEDLNETESKIIFAFIMNIADTMQTLVEQEIILQSYRLGVQRRTQGKALQKDFDTIYAELNQLKKAVNVQKR